MESLWSYGLVVREVGFDVTKKLGVSRGIHFEFIEIMHLDGGGNVASV